jgi:hypothetical protein
VHQFQLQLPQFQCQHTHRIQRECWALFLRNFGVSRDFCAATRANRSVLDQVGADVAGHDQDDVAEVDVPAERVGQAAFLHDLQQHVEHVRVGLLDLVEQHDRVRPAADALGELAALFVADVAGRRADQAADVVLLHVLGHVDLHQRVLVAEHELGQRLGQQRLADAEGPMKMKLPIGRVRVLQAGARPADRLGDRLDRLVLADDRLVQLLLQLAAALGLFLLQRVSGTPVILLTTSAMTSSSTTPSISLASCRATRADLSFLGAQLLGLSRSSAARS